ncbi:MAG: hypothetical protein KUL88_13720 [Rhizobium sp.]|nr:hypothetical protein [Rhizobium sp.]
MSQGGIDDEIAREMQSGEGPFQVLRRLKELTKNKRRPKGLQTSGSGENRD